jgi:AcrR family transcriptional regulator
MSVAKTERGWRGTPDLWLDAAYGLLVEGGVEAVKVMPLADRLGLSRTSFYWHFPDREALLAGLVARWQAKNTGNSGRALRGPGRDDRRGDAEPCRLLDRPGPVRQPAGIRDADLGLDRSGGGKGDGRGRCHADGGDHRAVPALRLHETEADTRARTLYLTQVGYIALRSQESLDLRMGRIPSYVLTFSGVAPTEAEIAAFRARHGVR